MKALLNDIADIQIGYQNRGESPLVNRDSKGSHKMIQVKDLDSDGKNVAEVFVKGGTIPCVWSSDLLEITPSGKPERYLVTKGHVLFLYRGRRLSAAAITESLKDTIAAYHFYILKPDASKVLPEYLAWFINHPKPNAFLTSFLRGSHIPMLPKNDFLKLEVIIPPIKTQRSIVELERLRQKEEFILSKLVDARKRLINGLGFQAATSTGQK